MEEPLDTRHSLILRLRDPTDAAAWREFTALYGPLVYRLARRKGLQDADACDLCQEVFLRVARAVDDWNPEPSRGSFRGWLSRVAQNLLLNFLMRREQPGTGRTSVQELLNAQAKADASAAAVFEAEYRRRLFHWAAEEVEAEFTPLTWQAFWRSAVGGQSPKTVAADLGLSIGAVYIARSRVLARLRKRIEQAGDQAAAIVCEVEHGGPIEPL